MKCLDLFCGAGGASTGLHRAGFEVVGADIKPQPNYPFEFRLGDALDISISGFDFVWASPPCQRFSQMSHCRRGLSSKYPDFIAAVRDKLLKSGLPYVIENVEGCPLINPIMLCGPMFGLRTYRHRIFESNVTLRTPAHPKHNVPTSKAGHWEPGTFISVAGHCAPIAEAKSAMGIDWMNRAELAEAIPPAYSEFIGRQILQAIV